MNSIARIVIRVIIAGGFMVCWTTSALKANELTSANDVLEYYFHNSPEPVDSITGAPWSGPAVYYRLTTDLNEDPPQDILLGVPWNLERNGNAYHAFLSSGQHYTHHFQDPEVIISEDACYVGYPTSIGKPAIISIRAGGSHNGAILAYYVDQGKITSTRLQSEVNLSEDTSPLLMSLVPNYRKVTPELIPISLVETLWNVTQELSTYLAARETMQIANPQTDYCERHLRPFGKTAADDRELLRLDIDLNQDGQPETLLSSSTERVIRSGINVGYYWECYVSSPGGYRWYRDTLLLAPDFRGDSRELIGYIRGEEGQITRVTYSVASGKFQGVNEEDLTLGSDGPFAGLPNSYSVVSITCVPFSNP